MSNTQTTWIIIIRKQDCGVETGTYDKVESFNRNSEKSCLPACPRMKGKLECP